MTEGPTNNVPAEQSLYFHLLPASAPLLVSVPHAGSILPEDIVGRLNETAHSQVDTDWHVDRLAEGLGQLGAGLIVARCSRYVIDLNRPPDDQPLYAGPTTGLVPTETFDGRPLYRGSDLPDIAERDDRLARFWQPYHAALAAQLASIREEFGHAVLLDLHSIASQVPRLFQGQLPALNLGTDDGRSCDRELQQAVIDLLEADSEYSYVVNGRFKGGFITRNYGRPENGVHALQLEIAQRCYLDEENPANWDAHRAVRLQALLVALVATLMSWKPST